MNLYSKTLKKLARESIELLAMADIAPTTCFQKIVDRAITDDTFQPSVIKCKVPFFAHLLHCQSTKSKLVCVMLLDSESYSAFKNDFFKDYSESQILESISNIPSKTLFGLTITDSLAEMIINDEDYDSNLSNLQNATISYFGYGVIDSLVLKKRQGKLKNTTFKKALNQLLDSCLEYKIQGQITDIMLIKLISDAYAASSTDTVNWLSNNLKSLTPYHFVCKEILSIVSCDYRTPCVSHSKILKTILSDLSATDFMRIVYSDVETNKIYLKDNSPASSRPLSELKSVFLAEKIFTKAGANTKNIVSILSLMKKNHDKGYLITPELITSAFFRTSSYHYDCLTRIKDIDDVPSDIKDWIVEQAKASKNFDLDLAICAILEGLSHDEETVKKLSFLLDSFDTELRYVPSAFAITRGIATSNTDIISRLLKPCDNNFYSKKDYERMAEGFHKDTPNEVIENLLDFFTPYIQEIISNNSKNDSGFDAFKALHNIKKSQHGLARAYLKKHLKDEDIINKINGKKQLQFYLDALNLTPYCILTKDISDKINGLCVELIGE